MVRSTTTSPPAASRCARIVIVDDHPIVRQGCAKLIASEGNLDVCGEAEGTTDALDVLAKQEPDLVLVDLSLRDGSGIELIKDAKSRWPDLKMLVVSMHDETLFAERALRAGAMGYVNKQEATDRLVDAIHSVLDGNVYLSERMTNRMLCRSIGSENFSDESPIESLSDRELEVFELIGKGETTRKIAEKLRLSPKTVETYRENIKDKLHLQNATELTRHAVQWVLEQP